jgi:hypothetical protein
MSWVEDFVTFVSENKEGVGLVPGLLARLTLRRDGKSIIYIKRKVKGFYFG